MAEPGPHLLLFPRECDEIANSRNRRFYPSQFNWPRSVSSLENCRMILGDENQDSTSIGYPKSGKLCSCVHLSSTRIVVVKGRKKSLISHRPIKSPRGLTPTCEFMDDITDTDPRLPLTVWVISFIAFYAASSEESYNAIQCLSRS